MLQPRYRLEHSPGSHFGSELERFADIVTLSPIVESEQFEHVTDELIIDVKLTLLFMLDGARVLLIYGVAAHAVRLLCTCRTS
jgi:hypothetical protein